jgi:hypothetical protein
MRAVRLAVAAAAVAVMALAGCAFVPQVVNDDEYYGSVEALDEGATVIVRGTVTETQDSATVSAMTIHRVRIDEQYQGSALVRGSVDVMQPGPVASTSRSDEVLEVGEEYVLFLLVEQRHRAEPAGIVGGPQGTFLIDQNGALTQQFAANAGDGLTEEESVTLDWQQLEALRQ